MADDPANAAAAPAAADGDDPPPPDAPDAPAAAPARSPKRSPKRRPTAAAAKLRAAAGRAVAASHGRLNSMLDQLADQMAAEVKEKDSGRRDSEVLLTPARRREQEKAAAAASDPAAAAAAAAQASLTDVAANMDWHQMSGNVDATVSDEGGINITSVAVAMNWHQMSGNVRTGETEWPDGIPEPKHAVLRSSLWKTKLYAAMYLKEEGEKLSAERDAEKQHALEEARAARNFAATRGTQRRSSSAPSVKVGPKDFFFGTQLGEGAYARVVHARRKVTHEEYAVKIMEKAFIKREKKVSFVMMEKNVLRRIAHPHIVKLYFTFQDKNPGNLYMVMDLCYGELQHLIEHHAAAQSAAGNPDHALTLHDAQFYVAEIVEALAYLHGCRIVHRDLKPENILLDFQGHVKVADFGTALDEARAQGNDDTAFCGTAQYVSPEVLEDRQANKGCDLWALGCIVFQVRRYWRLATVVFAAAPVVVQVKYHSHSRFPALPVNPNSASWAAHNFRGPTST